MKHLRTIYFILFIVGSVVPTYFFIQFLNENSLDPDAFSRAIFASNPAANFSSQLFISCLVFSVLIFSESKGKHVLRNILLMVLTFAVGLSSSLPLFLYLREKTNVKKINYSN